MDPLGNIPFFLAALKHVDPGRQARVIARELLIAYAAIVGFLFACQFLLAVLHLSAPALAIARGVVLFLIAVRIVFPTPARSLHERAVAAPVVVALRVEFGRARWVVATELLRMGREPGRWAGWLTALALAWVATAGIVLVGSRLRAYLGEKGLTALERLMGMLLVAVAI